MPRATTAGFSLIETLIAFALVVTIVSAGYAVIGQAMGRQQRLVDDLELSKFGRSILTEYVVTFPSVPKTGNYQGIWEWEIRERRIECPDTAAIGVPVDHWQIEARVWLTNHPKNVLEVQTAVVRSKATP